MTIIYRKSDLVDIEIDDLTFKIKPLSYMERVDIMSTLSNEGGKVIENAAKATFLTMKYGIKKVSGAKLADGTDYEIGLDADGNISEESIDDLLNLKISANLGLCLHNFLNGVPEEIIDPNTGEVIKGVKLVLSKGVPKK